jgi:hypothetical protein
MPIIYDGGFFLELSDNRIAVVDGRLGSGKTLIGHDLAEYYLKKGYKFVTNIRSVWADDMRTIIPNEYMQIKTFFLIDEGGAYVRTAQTVNSLSLFARKLDTYIIFTGKKLPHEDLCELELRIYYDLQRNLGLPFKIWRWEYVQGRKRYGDFLVQAFESKNYGLYSTIDPGDFPGEIVNYLVYSAKQLFAKFGREYKIQDVARGDVGAGTDLLEEFNREFAKSAREISREVPVQRRETGRRSRRR